MNIKIQIPCTCGKIIEGQFNVIDRSLKASCPDCGVIDNAFVDPSFTIGDALVCYAENVLSNDTNFAILLSGMAIDCYLSRLFYKGRIIEELMKPNYNPEVAQITIQKESIRIGDFLEKVKKIEQLLFPNGTKVFLDSHSELKQEITKGFPSLNSDEFPMSVRDQVMWKRNNIIHVSQHTYSIEDAFKTIQQAKMFIKVFKAMDKEKSNA